MSLTIITYPTLLRFETELRNRYGDAARVGACAILEGLELPVPGRRDYLAGKESLQVFLQDHGLVLRFGYPARSSVSDHVLQPLKKIALSENADFEINPGVRIGGSPLAKLMLKASLFMQGENLPRHEMVTSNIGSIRVDQHHTHSIVIDRCAVVPLLKTSFNQHGGIESGMSEDSRFFWQAPMQAVHFSQQRELAQECFGADNRVISANRQAFFAACADQVLLADDDAEKRLFNGWIAPDIHRPRQQKVLAAALDYAARY